MSGSDGRSAGDYGDQASPGGIPPSFGASSPPPPPPAAPGPASTSPGPGTPIPAAAAPTDKRQQLFDLLARAQWDHARKLDAWKVLRPDGDNLRKVAGLQALGLPADLLSALTEILVSE